jgi:hypothetical protein
VVAGSGCKQQFGLQRMMNKLNETSMYYNMKINVAKTKVMRICRKKGKTMKVTVN